MAIDIAFAGKGTNDHPGSPDTVATASGLDATGFTHVVIGVKHEGASTSITPSGVAVSWEPLTLEDVAATGNDLHGQMFWGRIDSPGSGLTVTVTLGAARPYISVGVWFMNADTGRIVLVDEVTAEGSGTAIDAGTLSNPDGLSVVSVLLALEYAGISHSPSTGWTEDFDGITTNGETNFTAGYSRGPETDTTIDPACTQSDVAAWGALAAMFAEVESIEYVGQDTNTGGLADGTDWGDVPIGYEAPDRRIIVVFFGIWNHAGSTDPTPDFTLSIDSNEMDVVVAPHDAGVDANDNRSFCGIFELDYPTGTTADFNMTFPGGFFFDGTIFVYAGYALSTVLDTATLAEASGDGAGNMDLDVEEDGAVVAGAGGYTLTTPRVDWTGLNEDEEQTVYGNDVRSTASLMPSADESPRTIVANEEIGVDGLDYIVGSAASWSSALAAGGGNDLIEGSVTFSITPSATLLGRGQLQSTFTGITLTPSATLTADGRLVATFTGITFTPSATLRGKGALQSTIATTFTPSATLLGRGALVTSTTGITMTPSGTLLGKGALSATVPIAFDVSAHPNSPGQMAATIPMSFAVDGTLLGTGALVSTISIGFTPSATLVGEGELVASLTMTFTPSATAATPSGEIVGDIAFSLTPSATIRAKGRLVANVPIEFFVQARPVQEATEGGDDEIRDSGEPDIAMDHGDPDIAIEGDNAAESA